MEKSTETTYKLTVGEVKKACMDFICRQEGFKINAQEFTMNHIMKTVEPPPGMDMGHDDHIEEFVGIELVG